LPCAQNSLQCHFSCRFHVPMSRSKYAFVLVLLPYAYLKSCGVSNSPGANRFTLNKYSTSTSMVTPYRLWRLWPKDACQPTVGTLWTILPTSRVGLKNRSTPVPDRLLGTTWWLEAHQPLSPVIKLGIRHPRKKERKNEIYLNWTTTQERKKERKKVASCLPQLWSAEWENCRIWPVTCRELLSVKMMMRSRQLRGESQCVKARADRLPEGWVLRAPNPGETRRIDRYKTRPSAWPRSQVQARKVSRVDNLAVITAAMLKPDARDTSKCCYKVMCAFQYTY